MNLGTENDSQISSSYYDYCSFIAQSARWLLNYGTDVTFYHTSVQFLTDKAAIGLIFSEDCGFLRLSRATFVVDKRISANLAFRYSSL